MAGWKLCLRLLHPAPSSKYQSSFILLFSRSRRLTSVGSDPDENHQEWQNSCLGNVFSDPVKGSCITRLGKGTSLHLLGDELKVLAMNTQKFPVRMNSQLARPVSEIQRLCTDGQLDKALDVLSRMDEQGTIPSSSMYVSLFKLCTIRKSLAHAKRVHTLLAKYGFESSQYLGESVVNTLVKCGGLEDALQVFHRLPHRTVFSWTAMISGYTIAGQGKEALRMYYSMRDEGLEPNKYTFVSLLKACISISDLKEGRRIHAEVVKRGLESDLFVRTCLVHMYAKCGSVADAQNVFEGLLQRDVVLWNAMIAGYSQQGQPQKALQLYRQLLEQPVSPDDRTLVSALQACGMLAERDTDTALHGRGKYLDLGRAIHAEAAKRGYETDVFTGNTLVSMYGKCGAFGDAHNVFNRLSRRNVVSWNAMIAAYCQQGKPHITMQFYEQMLQEGVSPTSRTFVCAFQACGMLGEKEEGTFLHEQAIKRRSLKNGKSLHVEAWRKGYDSDIYIANTVMGMYGKCGSILDAKAVFDGLPQHTVVSWNIMLAAYASQGKAGEILELYEQMRQEGVTSDDRTIVSVIQACGMLADKEEDDVVDGIPLKVNHLKMGKVVHADAWRKGFNSDVFIGNSLVSMYGKCGSVLDAEVTFDGLSRPDVVSWNAMLVASAQQGHAGRALQLYEQMLEGGDSPNDRTFVSILQACGMFAGAEEDGKYGQTVNIISLEKGKAIHADAWAKGFLSDMFICNTLVSMYTKCGSIVDAHNVFNEFLDRGVVVFSMLMAAYAQRGQAERTLQLYEQMLEESVTPDNLIIVSALQACGMIAEKEDNLVVDAQVTKLKSLTMGKAIHADAWSKGLGSDVFIGNTLINMYGKCGSIVDAENVFDGFSHWDVVSWTAMISAYIQQGLSDKAFEVYTEMQEEGVAPNEITMVCILQACSNAGRLDLCRQIHHSFILTGKDLSPHLGNTIIHAYGRCSSMINAQEVLRTLTQPDVVSWNALIAGYARQGDSVASLRSYEEMRLAGINPDGVTFLSLLAACSHAGLVDKGIEFFESMTRVYGVTPNVDHYVTVIDLLGRAGYFTDVEHLLSIMPVQPNLCTWLCLMSACRKHGKVLLGKRAFDCAVHLQPKHPAPYVLMSSIYAHAGLSDSAMEVHELRQKAGAWKKPGQSWIGNGLEVRTFLAGEHKGHQQLSELLVIISLELAVLSAY